MLNDIRRWDNLYARGVTFEEHFAGVNVWALALHGNRHHSDHGVSRILQKSGVQTAHASGGEMVPIEHLGEGLSEPRTFTGELK